MNILDVIKSDEFRAHLRENIIAYKEVNGYKTVDEDFFKRVINSDPIDMMERFFKAQNINFDKDFVVGSSLVLMHYQEAIKEEISNMTGDLKNGNYQDYIDKLSLSGFEVIYEKECSHMTEYSDDIRPERESILWNQEHGMMVTLNSYNYKKINSANLYCNVLLKNNRFDSDLVTVNSIPSSEVYTLKTDMREFPMKKIEETLTYYKPVKEWREFDEIKFYSYLSHNKDSFGNIDWVGKMEEKFNTFPEYVKEAMLSKLSTFDEREKDFLQRQGLSEDLFKFIDAVEELPVHLLEDIKENDFIFNLRFTNNVKAGINQGIIDFMKDKGVQNPSNYIEHIVAKVQDMDMKIEDRMDSLLTKIKEMNREELEYAYHENKTRVEYNIASEPQKQLFKAVENRLNIEKQNPKSKFH